MEAAVAQLGVILGKELTISVESGYETQAVFTKLDSKAQGQFATKLSNFVASGIAGRSKESLLTFLGLSATARAKFAAAVSKIVVDVSPPAKIKNSKDDLQIEVNEMTGEMLVICKFQAVNDGGPGEGWGLKVDAAMQLCILTEGYIEKAKLVMAQAMAEAGVLVPNFAADIDWSFTDDLLYKKLAEDARQRTVAAAGTTFKAGVLSLAKHLARSARATGMFQNLIKSVLLWVDCANRTKAPFEILEQDGVLRVGVPMKGLDTAAPSWGVAVDERFALLVVEEEGIKSCENAALQHVQALPLHRIDFDWTFMSNDKWRKMRPEDKQAFFASLVKKTLQSGVNDRKEGLVAYLNRSSRARSLFTQKVGVVRVKIEFGGKPLPMLQDAGVLVFPVLSTNVDDIQPWGSMADSVLGLRVEEEEALKKAQIAVDKASGGFPCVLDWGSFLEEPALIRGAVDKRLTVISSFVSYVQTGLSGRQGLMAAGTNLTDKVDSIVVRAVPAVKAKAPCVVDLRYGADRVLEVLIKTASLTSAKDSPEPLLQYFNLCKGDPLAAQPVTPYHLLVEGDPGAACAVEAAPVLPNLIMGEDCYNSTPLASSGITATAPPLSSKPVAPPPVASKPVAPPPAVKTPSSPPPAKAAPAPAKAAPAPVKAPVVAAPVAKVPVAAPVPSGCPDDVPADFGCPQVYLQCEALVNDLNKTFGLLIQMEIDWSFVNSNSFTSLPDPQKKALVNNINMRVFAPLVKDLTTVGKSHALYGEAIRKISCLRFAFDSSEKILDMSSGKAGKTHYSVVVSESVLSVACNLSQHMAGIIPSLEGKLQVAFGVAHLIAVEEATNVVSKIGDQYKLPCFLDTSYSEHPSFLKGPISIDTITWWKQLGKEAVLGVEKVLKALDVLNKDPIFNAEFRSRFSSIRVFPDATNSVRDVASPASWGLSEDKAQYQLVFKYNLNDGTQAGQTAAQKIPTLIDVKLSQAIAAAMKDAQEQLQKFKMSLPSAEMQVSSFFESDAFKALQIDKQIAGCQALKLFLGGVIRMLGVIITKNLAVVKQKTRVIEFGLNAGSTIRGADSEVSYDDSGILRIVQNMNSASKPDPTIAQKIDGLLDVTMVNLAAEVTLEMKQRSAALSTSLQIPNLTVGLDFAFERDASFAPLPPQNKQAKVKVMRRHVEQVVDCLTKFGPKDCVALVAVLVLPDGTNTIKDPFHGATDADHYNVHLDRDGLMQIIINLDSVEKPLGRVAHKLEQALALHRARQGKYHDGPEYFEWESLRYHALLNDTVLAAFELSLFHCKDTVKAFAQAVENSRAGSPPGAAAIAKINKFEVRMDPRLPHSWEVLNPVADELHFVVSFDFVKNRQHLTVLEYKEAIEWTLQSTVEVEKYHCLERIDAAEQKLKKAFGRHVPVVFDWATYVDTPDYVRHSADACRSRIRQLSTQLLNAVIHGALEVADHPVGSQLMKQHIQSFEISYGPQVDMVQRLRQACKMVIEPSGRCLITFRNLDQAIRVPYKIRLEFELDAIVAVAVHNNSTRRETVSKLLGGIPITDNIGAFAAHDEFRFGIDVTKQPQVIEAVVAAIPEHVLAVKEDGMLGVWDRAKGKVKRVNVTVVENDPELPTVHGKLELSSDGVLDLTYDLGLVLASQQSVNWRARIADAVGFLDELGQKEANEKLALTAKELAYLPVSIDWKSFVTSPPWLALPAADRYERMHNFGGEYARDALLGYWGLKELSFYDKVKEDILKRVKAVELAVNPAAGRGAYTVQLAGTTLRLIFNLDNLAANQKHEGCRERVESAMKLRPLIETCAKEELEKNHVVPLSERLKKKVVLNWSFMQNEDYLEQRDYVQYIRFVGLFLGPLLVGYSSAPEGLPWMCERNREAAEFYSKIATLEVVVDGDCKTKPPQVRYVNGNIACEAKGPVLTIKCRRDWMSVDANLAGVSDPPSLLQTHYGCGSVVEYYFAEGVCKSAEEDLIDKYRDRLIENEENRREYVISSWENQCRRNVEEYNDDVQRYARAATENCSSCSGKGWWGGGMHKCSSCSGRGNKQANMRPPQMPHNPPEPRFSDIHSTDWRALALSDSCYSVSPKVKLLLEEHERPKRPTFAAIPVKWSQKKAESLGGEDQRPEDVPKKVVNGFFSYEPLSVINPDEQGYAEEEEQESHGKKKGGGAAKKSTGGSLADEIKAKANLKSAPSKKKK